MPRWTITVYDYPALKPKESYLGRMRSIERLPKRGGLRAVFEHIVGEQSGRTHELHIPLPLRPGGLGASLFTACGIDVTPGARIAPKIIFGRHVRAAFERDANGAWRISGFDPEAQDE